LKGRYELETFTQLKIAVGKNRKEISHGIDYGRTYWAKVKAFSVGTEKPLKVGRDFKGAEVEIDCYVTQRIAELYQAGKLAAGDFVLVQFVDGDPDNPITIDKAYKSW